MKLTFAKMLCAVCILLPYTYSQCVLQICSTAEKEMIDMIIDKGPQLAGLLNSTVLHSESLYSLRHNIIIIIIQFYIALIPAWRIDALHKKNTKRGCESPPHVMSRHVTSRHTTSYYHLLSHCHLTGGPGNSQTPLTS